MHTYTQICICVLCVCVHVHMCKSLYRLWPPSGLMSTLGSRPSVGNLEAHHLSLEK